MLKATARAFLEGFTPSTVASVSAMLDYFFSHLKRMPEQSVILLVEDRDDDVLLIRKAFQKAGLTNPFHPGVRSEAEVDRLLDTLQLRREGQLDMGPGPTITTISHCSANETKRLAPASTLSQRVRLNRYLRRHDSDWLGRRSGEMHQLWVRAERDAPPGVPG